MRTIPFAFPLAALSVALLGAGCQPAAPPSALPPYAPVIVAPSPAPPSPTASAPASNDAHPLPAIEAQRLLDEPARRVVRFSNGFTLIVQQNKTAPVVSTRLLVKAGSLTEGPHTGAGLSHIVEHLVASAVSAKRQQSENTRLLMQMGNDSNAFTDADQTCYFITTTADKFSTAAEVLIDLVANSTFTRQQFAREYEVVQRELEMDEVQIDQLFFVQSIANRFPNSPAGVPVVGTKPAFQTLTFEDCQAYYRQMYVPDNMILSLAGDIDPDAAEACVLTQIRDLRRRPAPPQVRLVEPPVTAPRLSVAHADIPQARIRWAFPTPDMFHPDQPALDLLARILGGGDSSPLVRQVRDAQALATTISSTDTVFRFDEGQLEINATLDPDKIPAAQTAVFATLDALLNGGITDQALARAKAQAAAEIALDFQSPDQIAVRNVDDFLIAGTIDFTPRYAQRVQTVTRQDVQAAAQKYLSRDHLLTTLLLPLKAKDPFATAASALPAPGAPDPVKRVVLPNGVTLLLSRNPGAPLTCFNLYVLGGLLAEDDATNGIGTLMMNALARQTAARPHQQVADFLDDTGTSVIGTSGTNAFQLSMACLADHTPDAFALFAEMALRPQFTAEELAQIRRNPIFAAETTNQDWAAEAFQTTRDLFYASSPYKRLVNGNPDVMAKITPSQITAHYNKYFLDPAHMVIAIAGDIDPAAAEKWAAPFAALPAPAQKPIFNLFSVTNDAVTIVRPTDKDAATIMLAYPGATMTSPDRDALLLLKTYLGGYSSPAGSLLHETLRSRGLVYTVKATSLPGPAGGIFLITALGEPQAARTIADTIQSLIEGVKKGDLPQAQFELARDQLIAGKKLDQPTIADISSRQALNEVLGIGWDDDLKLPPRIAALTRADLIRVANKYLTTPTLVVFTPEAK